jgi:ATP-binding cassette subfamily F protein 3
LAKATAKLQQKQEKRDLFVRTAPATSVTPAQTSSATASQVTSKKEAKLEAKGCNRSQDIRIENFDVSFGDRYEAN